MSKKPTHSSKPPVKPKAAPKSKTTPKVTSGYDWGNGRGGHSIPLAQHTANQQGMQAYGARPGDPVAGPSLTAGQAYAMATAAANRVYQPQIAQAQSLQASAQPWYQNYVADTKARQAAAQAYAQPLLANAQNGVANAGTTAPGLDPSSAQYATDQQAAQGRQAIAQLGASTLGADAVATDAYFGGQQNIAARDLPQTQAYLGQQVGQLQAQRGQAVTDEFGKIRTNEQNYGIAQQTLFGNQSNMAADNAQAAANATQTAADKKAARIVSRKNTRDRITAAGVKTQAAADNKAAKDKTAADAKTAKHKADIQKATGAVQTKVTDARDAWERYAKARNPKTTLDPTTGDPVPVMDPKTKKPVMIGATPDQIKARLRKDGYTETEIHIMLQLRGKKKLTPADVKRLKDQDPNIRIPREWLPSKTSSTVERPKTAATPAPKNDRSGYGDRPT